MIVLNFGLTYALIGNVREARCCLTKSNHCMFLSSKINGGGGS